MIFERNFINHGVVINAEKENYRCNNNDSIDHGDDVVYIFTFLLIKRHASYDS
ncbi:MAG: hypothetical protein QXI83_01850 [Desulfurococcaceae archaeon]